jgi:hypothetical protein
LAEVFGASRVYDTGAVNLRHAMRATRQCGRVVYIGFYGSNEPPINLGEEFLHNRLTLLASLVVGLKLFWRDIQYGWASTNFFNALMFGCLFFVLVIVCEYLAEIRGDVKNRPLYVVQDEFHSNTMVADAERRNVVAHEDDAETIWSATKPRSAA